MDLFALVAVVEYTVDDDMESIAAGDMVVGTAMEQARFLPDNRLRRFYSSLFMSQKPMNYV